MRETAVRPLVSTRQVVDGRAASVPLLVFVGLTIVGLLSLLYLTQTSDVATMGYEIQTLRAEKERWERHNDQLRVEAHRLRSLARIEEEAKVRLEMGPPENLVFVPVELAPVPHHAEAPVGEVGERRSLVQQAFGVPNEVVRLVLSQ